VDRSVAVKPKFVCSAIDLSRCFDATSTMACSGLCDFVTPGALSFASFGDSRVSSSLELGVRLPPALPGRYSTFISQLRISLLKGIVNHNRPSLPIELTFHHKIYDAEVSCSYGLTLHAKRGTYAWLDRWLDTLLNFSR